MRFGPRRTNPRGARPILLAALAAAWFTAPMLAQSVDLPAQSDPSAVPYQHTTDDYNLRLDKLNRELSKQSPSSTVDGLSVDYRIGADDQLDISVLEAVELDRAPRVSAGGEISLAMVGTIRAAGLTTRELEIVIEELLREHYIKDPHVSVQVRDMQSHPVVVFGAVKKPGVFQIRGPKTVVELISMAEGLDVDAGDTVIVEHHNGAAPPTVTTAVGLLNPPPSVPEISSDEPTSPVEHAELVVQVIAPPARTTELAANSATNPGDVVVIDLKKLLSTGDPRLNVLVYPGDVVKVPRADLVYVVGEVAKPGGFEIKTNENVSVLQAIALAQGLTHTSSSAHSRIIRTDPATGTRQEIPIDIDKILVGKAPDPVLEPRDIVFVPNSMGRTAFYRGLEAAISIGSGVAIYRP
jgi:polysaccharide export outer membrane protein